MSKLVLFDHIESQNGYKVRLALSNLNIDYEFKHVDLLKGEHKKDWFLKLNPNGKIPVLQDGDETVWESNAILLYVGRKFMPNSLIPQDLTKLGKMLEWLFFETSSLQTSVQPARFMHLFIPEEKRDPAKVKIMVDRSNNALKIVDDYLSNNDFLAGDYSMADISCYGQIYIAPESGIDLNKFKNITHWQKRVEKQPGYVEMRTKVKV